MQVILLNPPYKEKFIRESRCQHRAAVWQTIYPPLTLSYMAGLLKGDHKVKILDAIAEERDVREVVGDISEYGADIVIMSTTSPTIESDLRFASELKKVVDARLGIFGVHATYFARELIKNPAIDFVIRGEPELIAYDLCASKDLHSVKGLTFKDDGRMISSPDSDPPDLDSLPYPAWDLVNLDLYKIPIKNRSYVLMATGRGCPSRCTFCVSPFYYGRRFRSRKVDSIIDEINFVKAMGIDDIFFFTDTFTLNKRFVIDLCNKIMEEGLEISWICNSRVDTINKETLQKMARAGCWLTSFGIESGSQSILDKAKKGIKLQDSREAVKMTKKAGIMVAGHFIFGLPGETEETIDRTIEFSKELDLDFAEFYIATPFPGSELYEVSRESGRLRDSSWGDYEYSKSVIDTGLDLESKRRQAYREFYLRRRSIFNLIRAFKLRNLPKLTLSGIRFMTSL